MSRPETVEIAASDGTVLRGLRGLGGADWVLLLHDVRADADLEDWNGLVPHLLGEIATVLAVDLRGHGASDGEWRADLAGGDVAAMIRFARGAEAGCVVIVADGASGLAALAAVETEPADGLALISPRLAENEPAPRGAGVAKLIVAGVRDPAARSALDRLRAASIGWALAVNLPTETQGTALLDGAWGLQTREHLLAFLRERRFLSGGERAPGGFGSPGLTERYLDRIGLRAREGEQ